MVKEKANCWSVRRDEDLADFVGHARGGPASHLLEVVVQS